MTIQRMDHVSVVVDDLEAANRVLRRTRHGAGGQGADRGTRWTGSTGSTASGSTSR